MDWTQPIDAYCERLGAGFWAEPLNAVSNLAFLVAAAAGIALWRRAGGSDRPVLLLAGLVAIIGIGSFVDDLMGVMSLEAIRKSDVRFVSAQSRPTGPTSRLKSEAAIHRKNAKAPTAAIRPTRCGEPFR